MSEEQKEMPEAIGSANCTITSPNGFPWQITLRQPSFEKLLKQILVAEQTFVKDRYKPDIKRGFGRAKKPVETVPGRQCPQCNNPLIYFEAKGRKHIKCSTQKYYNGQVQGCSFVEWADRLMTTQASPPVASPPITPPPPTHPDY